MGEHGDPPTGMRRKGLLAVVGLLVIFALVAGPFALARQGAVDVQEGPEGRILTATEISNRERDISPRGASIGDEFQLVQRVAEGGREIGTADVSCGFVRVFRPAPPTSPTVSVQCSGVATIGPDLLTYQGLNTFGPDSVPISRFVVTGGTGTFADAAGELRATESSGGSMLQLILR